MNLPLTYIEAREAETRARDQRIALAAALLDVDVTLGGDQEACVKLRAAARAGDGKKFDGIIAHRRINKLFLSGGWFFRRAA